jgi:3-deoxy-D-manno-octulosonic-acid transferase
MLDGQCAATGQINESLRRRFFLKSRFHAAQRMVAIRPNVVTHWPMLWLYRLLFLPALLALSPVWIWHVLRRGGYGHGFWQRLGFFPKLAEKTGKRRIWIHGVSVGEIQSLRPLVERLAEEKCYDLVVTATSSTGLAIAQKLYGALATVGVFPIDFYPCSRLAWSRIQPDLVLLADGELWPEHLANAHRHTVPVVVVNGRLSDKSYGRYRRLPGLFRWQTRHLTAVLASGKESFDRFCELGMDKKNVLQLGNLKCDRPALPPIDAVDRSELLLELGLCPLDANGDPTPILFGCSTWPGEEKLLLEVFAILRSRQPSWRLILTPRHGERRRELRQLLATCGVDAHFRSDGPAASTGQNLATVIDTTGELGRLIRLGTVAFLGKTLPPNAGSQSPLDAVAAGVPIVAGPNIGNFRDILSDLQHLGAAVIGSDRDAVADGLLALAENGKQRAAMATIGKSWLEKNAGATERICSAIRSWTLPSTVHGSAIER